jgi:ABC-type sugar transport system ATPase subunit
MVNMNNTFLEIQNLEIRYKDSEFYIKDFSLCVTKGEFVVLLGESGCGKTTILNSIAGFLHPINGDIKIDGKSVINLPPGKREIGMVFQGDSLFHHMNVYENLEFGLRARGVKSKERKSLIMNAISIVKLDDKAYSKSEELSSGQKQRVELARLLLRNGRLWLLDEPLSNLDPLLKYELRDEIKKIQQKSNSTTIYVTHSQSEALTLADRIAVLKDGKLIQYDIPSKIYDEPTNSYVAEFVGEPGINLFHAQIHLRNSNRQLEIEKLKLFFDLPPLFSFEDDFTSVGFRPEDTFDHVLQNQTEYIHASIISKEIRGNRILAKVRFSDCEFFVEGMRENFHNKSDIKIPIHLSKLKFFRKDGTRIIL